VLLQSRPYFTNRMHGRCSERFVIASYPQRYATLRKPMPKLQSELPRVLNASHATSIVVGIIIGSGIFLVPREMMAAVGSSRAVYAVWIVGGLLSLFGAMTYAEITAAHPRYGGEYAFLREAYGDLAGFLYMW